MTHVKTSSPCWPKGNVLRVSELIISGMKWSSAMCIPVLKVHSMATAGPITSDKPYISRAVIPRRDSISSLIFSDHGSAPNMPTLSGPV